MPKDMTHTSLFEVSWEVCNKVGGIHAVVSSKALQAVENFGERYYLLGPDLGVNPGFIETQEPGWDILRHAIGLRNLKCRFGRWDIPGRPKVVLVNFKSRFNQNQLLYELWNRYGVDSLTGGWDYVEPVMFSAACGEAIAAIYQALVEPAGETAVAHFHEWMCGAGLLAVKRFAPNVGTVFTTHATMLGRAMAGSGYDIYKQMNQINPQREAANHNITAKCSMERVAAREADCFTTVSKITSDEAAAFLGRTPDVLTVNGLDLRVIPDYSEKRQEPARHREKLRAAVGRLLRREMPANMRIMAISGRYEFHNKGVDVFLDAMAEVNTALRGTDTKVLALCAVMGGHTGVNPDAVSGDPDKHPPHGEWFITSHHVYDAPNDPILQACQRLGLDNRPDNPVQVVFVPALLDGKDGFLELTYDEMISACDLGIFPSWYEPWGYTPQESAAWSVPTVTTDLSGFGLWARDKTGADGEKNGVTIIPRRQTSYEDTVAALRAFILQAAVLSDGELSVRRKAVRTLIESCSWEQFFPNYLEAYTKALDKVRARLAGDVHEREEGFMRFLSGTSSATPVLHEITAVSQLPEALRRMRDLARNLWWCWQPEAVALFRDISVDAWEECNHNPVFMLAQAPAARLATLARDRIYLERLHAVLDAFDAYMATPPRKDLDGIGPARPIAYFSTEYGIHESLPIYSGGLGVLSGDHLKSASDLNLPLLGVGLLYKSGYFRQQIDKDGRQIAVYPQNNFATLPVERVMDAEGNPLLISIAMPGRELYAQTWLVRVGRVKLYLLDTDIQQNTPGDRQTTARLYEADRDCRIRQEILLGMGGVRLLRMLGIIPSVYHMNEGHSAFLVLERIRVLMEQRGLSLEAAEEVVRGSCVFTTHTPVPAGNECFTLDLMERYFSSFAKTIGLSWQDFLRFGRLEGSERKVFEMTVLALNHAYKANGVSRLHGEVSRYMWHAGWKGVSVTEVPIGYVTNGVHVPSYAGPVMRPILEEVLGPDWLKLPADSPEWMKLLDIPDARLWEAKRIQKEALLEALRKRLPAMCATLGVSRSMQKEMEARLTTQALVIGFARRFAPYKRANLIFADPERLQRMLSNPDRPVILLFAGKAHPADGQGIDIMQEVVRHCISPQFAGRIFFMDDYNLAVSRLLVQGCDVWLNTPRRPHEASGTSGMKLSVSGGLNASIADGWWCEGYDGRNGWTIGPVGARLEDVEGQSDYVDAESLYVTLEDNVISRYYERGEDGLPHRWLATAKRAMATLTAQFSSDRMVSDYVRDYYMPTAARQNQLLASDCALPKRLAQWKHDQASRFPGVQIGEVRIEGVDGDTILCGQPMTVTVTLNPGSMEPADLLVQLVAGIRRGDDFRDTPEAVDLKQVERLDDGQLVYSGSYTASVSGQYVYGVRVMANTEGLASPLETRLILWA